MNRRSDLRRIVVGVAAIAVSVTTLGACSSESPEKSLAIDLIDDAISAVDDRFGGLSGFYEINATSDGVNLFVSTMIDETTPGVVQARYTSEEGLVVADEPVPSEGPVFDKDAVDFDPDSIIEAARAQLSTALPRVFIITATAGVGNGSGVSYRLVMESQRGGRLVVFLGRDGTILGSDVLD